MPRAGGGLLAGFGGPAARAERGGAAAAADGRGRGRAGWTQPGYQIPTTPAWRPGAGSGPGPRGHLRSDGFFVMPQPGGWSPFARLSPAHDRRPRRIAAKLAVMFIFDCSGSMSAAMVTADGKPTTRLGLARNTLIASLAGLPRPRVRSDVGLIAYGHRVGWIRRTPAKW